MSSRVHPVTRAYDKRRPRQNAGVPRITYEGSHFNYDKAYLNAMCDIENLQRLEVELRDLAQNEAMIARAKKEDDSCALR